MHIISNVLEYETDLALVCYSMFLHLKSCLYYDFTNMFLIF